MRIYKGLQLIELRLKASTLYSVWGRMFDYSIYKQLIQAYLYWFTIISAAYLIAQTQTRTHTHISTHTH
jgi:hypothetical protein